MISIAPLTEFRLGHRANHLAIGPSGHVAAVSREGAGSILARNHSHGIAFRSPAGANDLSISADGSLLAVATRRGTVELISTSTLRTVNAYTESMESCHFGANGELWGVSRWDADTIFLEVRDPQTCKVMAATELPDPFGCSLFKILSHPDGEHVSIRAAGGQDGQYLFWARRRGSEILLERFADLDATTIPSFNRSGDRFLSIADARELRQYGFPHGPLLGELAWPFDETDNQIGDMVQFVDPDRALLLSTSGRLYLVDVTKMQLAGEVSIHGREPRPISEVDPNRSEPGLCSDVVYLAQLPTGEILSVHHQSPFREEGSDSILTWRLP